MTDQTYRTVRKFGTVQSAKVSLPYIGMDDYGEPTRNWAHIDIKADGVTNICPRKMKRIIRRWVKETLGRVLSPEETRMALKRVEYCVV